MPAGTPAQVLLSVRRIDAEETEVGKQTVI